MWSIKSPTPALPGREGVKIKSPPSWGGFRRGSKIYFLSCPNNDLPKR